jgi:hypothetical protein
MKKLLAVFLSAALILSLVPSVGAADGDRVEISFKIGDDTLLVNGSPVTVETPYVAGEGTTLVPLRVITEAFGASVTWVNETQEIILDYPDVSVTLQIDSTKAQVNSHEETLSVAPTLSENGVTMVPLRFLSETFGATVSYDNETSAITVVKESGEESGEEISAIRDYSTYAYIGDSYYGWMMSTPSSMMMSDRGFDGRRTLFTDENSNKILISVIDVDPSITTDKDFSLTKEQFSAYTLIQADKTTDSDGNFTMHFKARSKEDYIEVISIRTSSYYYDLQINAKYNSSEMTTLAALADSFKASYDASEDIRDLSDVENGYRTYEDSDLNFSLKVPSYCALDDSSLNEITFYGENGDKYTAASLSVYSKSETVTAELLAKKDSVINKKYANSKYITVTDVFPYTDYPLGNNACYYGIRSSSLPGGDCTIRDIFFEKGDYVYNLYIETSEKDNTIDVISASFSAEEIDAASTGILLRNDLDEETTYTSSYTGRWEMTLPYIWKEVIYSSDSGVYRHRKTGSLLYFSIEDSQNLLPSDTKEYASELYNAQRKSGSTMIKNVAAEDFGKRTFYTFTFSKTDSEDGTVTYATVATTIISGKIYTFVLSDDAEYYSAATMDEFKDAVASFKISK